MHKFLGDLDNTDITNYLTKNNLCYLLKQKSYSFHRKQIYIINIYNCKCRIKTVLYALNKLFFL